MDDFQIALIFNNGPFFDKTCGQVEKENKNDRRKCCFPFWLDIKSQDLSKTYNGKQKPGYLNQACVAVNNRQYRRTFPNNHQL